MSKLLSETANLRVAIAAGADLYNGNPTSDRFNMADYERAAFVVHHGAGATGTATFTVVASSDAAGTGAEAIPFRYRVHGVTAEPGAITEAAAAGFTIAAGADQIAIVEIAADACPDGKPFVALVATEVADSPVAGCVMMAMTGARYTDGAPPAAVS